MNYIELLKEINKAAKRIKLVNSVFDGDVYTNWNTETVSYGSVNIGLEDMTKNENTITYNLILYYGDRLLQDKSNMNSIWVDGFNVLQSIINGLADLTGQTSHTITFHSTVTKKLTDEQKQIISQKGWKSQ